jgi:hypothetical protein
VFSEKNLEAGFSEPISFAQALEYFEALQKADNQVLIEKNSCSMHVSVRSHFHSVVYEYSISVFNTLTLAKSSLIFMHDRDNSIWHSIDQLDTAAKLFHAMVGRSCNNEGDTDEQLEDEEQEMAESTSTGKRHQKIKTREARGQLMKLLNAAKIIIRFHTKS